MTVPADNDLLQRVDPTTRDILTRFRFDARLFSELQARVADGSLSPASNIVQGRVEPPPADAVIDLPAADDPRRREAYARGMAALRAGEVAVAVLNGGMATRFGGVVKGIVEAVDGKSFLEWKMEDAFHAGRVAGHGVPFLAMTSFATHEPTREFLDRLASERRPMPETRLFSQAVSLRLRRDGDLFLDADGDASPYAPGHGDFGDALRDSKTLLWLQRQGVRLITLSNVDNLGARLDPVVIGMHLLEGRPMTSEVTDKEPGDAGGAPALVDGRLQVVEGFRFPPSFDQDRIPVFNCNSFVFDLDALDRPYPLTWFYVEKKVGDEPVVQIEHLVNELTAFLPCTYLRVPRSGPSGRFFPIKTPADLVESRAELRTMLQSPVFD
jgi:UTP--glucose-1-phosphate uridylyltransferase